jgi:hypothetical protein
MWCLGGAKETDDTSEAKKQSSEEEQPDLQLRRGEEMPGSPMWDAPLEEEPPRKSSPVAKGTTGDGNESFEESFDLGMPATPL